MPRGALESFQTELIAEEQPETVELVPDTPRRILVVGNFSGGTARGRGAPISIDRDNFDAVLARLNPELQLADGTAIRFRELVDFHPDRLFQQAPVFIPLRKLRKRMADPATFRQAAAELQAWAGLKSAAPHPPPAAAPRAGGGLLDQMLEDAQPSPPAAAPARALDDFESVVRDIVAPHLEPKPDPRQAEVMAQLDAALAAHLRVLLHDPDFQALEAAWRAVYLLATRLETGEQCRLYVLDARRGEAADALAALGENSWAAIALHYTFGPEARDAHLLGRLAQLASRAGAVLLAAADPRLAGCESFGETPDPEDWTWQPAPQDAAAWQGLRRRPEAESVGLALPRFLLRMPYGKGHAETEEFPLEEMPGEPEHESYLWGNPALACALLLAEGSGHELDGLPVHIYKSAGVAEMKPCAEAFLTERAAEAILDRGIMPLLSVKSRDAAVLPRWQSLADPLKPLHLRW